MRAANSNSKDPLKKEVALESAAEQKFLKNVTLPLTALTDCLVDADTFASARFGRGRRKALGASALVQFCAICALLIWPLFATGSRLIAKSTIVIPPYGGMPHVVRDPAPKQPSSTHDGGFHPSKSGLQFHPPTHIPPKFNEGNVGEPSQAGVPTIGSGKTNTDYSGPIGLIEIPNTSSNTPPPPTLSTKAPTPRAPVSMSQGVVLALLTHRVEPIYPSIARQIHLEGIVELRAIIALDGTIQQLQVLSGNPILVRAAMEAVRQWRFRPTLLNGEPVEVDTFITVSFHIGQ